MSFSPMLFPSPAALAEFEGSTCRLRRNLKGPEGVRGRRGAVVLPPLQSRWPGSVGGKVSQPPMCWLD